MCLVILSKISDLELTLASPPVLMFIVIIKFPPASLILTNLITIQPSSKTQAERLAGRKFEILHLNTSTNKCDNEQNNKSNSSKFILTSIVSINTIFIYKFIILRL